MRVGIIAIQHESNTFLHGRTTLADFQKDVLLSGEAILHKFSAASHEIGGFFEGLEKHGIEAIPLFAARATPSGIITAETSDTLVAMALSALRVAPPLDGLLVAPHGAGVTEGQPDFDGFWLTEVRRAVGSAMPVVCTLDLHANVSQRMINACHATIAYRTNPHLDQRARGIEAADLLARHLRKEIHLVQALSMPPLAINIERQLTDEEPCASLYRLADEMLTTAGILSNSIVLGFPYADVAEMGTSVIVVANGDRKLAHKSADAIARQMLDLRDEFLPHLIPIDDAIDFAVNSPKPVCFLDTGDNVGGGSSGDGTVLAKTLLQRHLGGAFVMIFDPQSVEACNRAGIGAKITLEIGGKTDDLHGPPLVAQVRVKSFCDGRYTESQVRHGGWTGGEMGRCAVVETSSGLTILLTSHRTPPFSLEQVRAAGLDPGSFDYLIAKGVHAPVAAYREVCKTFIRVNTPGITNIDMTQLPYHHRRKPLFPFER